MYKTETTPSQDPVEREEQAPEPTPPFEEQEQIRWDWEFPKPRYIPKR